MRPGKRFGLSAVERSERHSRFAMLIKVPSNETEAVVAALSQQVRKLPATLRRSLTWDRGLEMAKHKDFTVATEVQVYFCDPQSSNDGRPRRNRDGGNSSDPRNGCERSASRADLALQTFSRL